MTREEAIKVIENRDSIMDYCESAQLSEALDMAIEALSAEPCEDTISRQVALVGLASIAKAKAKSDAQKSLMGRVMFFTEQLPPVTPKQKMGHWENGCCSECGCDAPAYIIDWKWQKDMDAKFCPMCGARMAESEENNG